MRTIRRTMGRHVVSKMTTVVAAAQDMGGLSLGTWKAIAVMALFLMAAGGCATAKYMQAGRDDPVGERFLLFGNVLSAGVLLAASLVHMLPDATEGIEASLPDFPLPLAPAIAGAAFTCLVLIEEAIEAVQETGEPDMKRRGSKLERQVSRSESRRGSTTGGHSAPMVPAGAGAVQEIKAFLLFAALSFHSMAEGLGLGAADNAGVFISVLVAILAHKFLAGFALGSSMAQSGLPTWRFWAFVFIFSIASPIGAVLGAVLSGASGFESTLTSGLCLALASGTFLQVSTMELLPQALSSGKHRVIASVALVLGFSFMTLLAIWA